MIRSHINFLNLWIGLSVSELAGSLLTFALSLIMFKSTSLTGSIGTMWLFYFIPSIIIQLVIGSYLDRYSKKLILIFIQLIKATVLAVFIVLFYYLNELYLIYIFQIILGCLTPIFTPVSQAILPNVSNQKDLVQYNSILDATSKLMVACGPIISGVIISISSSNISIIISICLFFISGISLCFIKEIKNEMIKKEKWMNQLKEGFAYYFDRKEIVKFGNLIFAVQFSVGVITVINLPYILDVLNGDMKDYGIFMASFPFGYVIGASIVKVFSKFKDINVMIYSLLIASTTFMFLGFNRYILLAYVIEFISGIALAIFNSYNTTMVQKNIDQKYSARIFTLRLAIIRTAIPIGVGFATLFSELLSIRGLYIINTIVIGLFIMVFIMTYDNKKRIK
ncbi:MFS transporter [Macrococcus equipercicus]|uniref:MFS transporter n=1 Tax=Macrococcus equipercicus TaxID=69967 RepID=A0A9Q9F1L0_9STAP|nr:MFS transporter [Macrococcus equipercicus]UTH14052.1 MFS transporter [Macrococcus equipercicus]